MSEQSRQILNKISTCEICGNSDLSHVLDLGFHAMCDDLIKIGEQKKNEKYPINILFCKNCKTAHQQYQVPKKILFPATYHYRASLTNDVLNGMRELVDSCESKFGCLSNKKILDIGCNDGSLLSIFKEKGAITYGIEPTNAAIEAKLKHHNVVNNFFDQETARDFVENYGKPDLITFTNVFAHIENFADILAALDILMDGKVIIVIENHYLGSIFKHNQFDTFYHEHPRTYSYTSFIHIAKALNSDIISFEFPERYGGNIRVFLSRASNYKEVSAAEGVVLQQEAKFYEEFKQLSVNMGKWRLRKRNQLLKEIESHGRLRAKAFPGRAAILLELLMLTEDHIAGVYEQQMSPKVGYYVPGTGIPILSDDELDVVNSAPIINLAWHIQSEILSYLNEKGFHGHVLPIIDQDDFR